ncbi:FAD dependent oxidoreductase, partial [Piedraia hortae CBS 480.64]
RLLSTSSPSPADFTHIIIGAGVIGLSIARHLQSLPSTKVLLLERHPSPGNETSSRNSEVIHAGIYYPPSSLKSKLCVRGKELLYSYCERRRIPYRRCGKWVVAQTEREVEALEEIAARAGAVGVPTRFLSKGEVAAEPAVRAHAVLESRTTGIVDSHAFMLALQGEFEEKGGLGAWNSMVTGVEP